MQPAVLDHDGLVATDAAGFEVGGGIALEVPELRAVGERLVQTEQHVVDYVGVGVLVDRDARRRMGTPDDADTIGDPAGGHRLLHLRSDRVHPLCLGLERVGEDHGATIVLVSVPILSMTISTLSPTCMPLIPPGVPVRITSPGSSVITLER